jgi:hypothetical protein
VLYQLSYAPRLRDRLYRRPGRVIRRPRGRLGRVAMAALFSAITLAFALIALWCAAAGQWILAAAAAALTAWMATLAWAALRRMRL